MAKLTWLAGLALGAVMLGGCGQTESGDQEPSATAGGNTDPLSITSDASEKSAETSLNADRWLGKPGNQIIGELIIADAKDIRQALSSLENKEAAQTSLRTEISNSRFSPMVYKDRFGTIHAMGCRGSSCGSSRAVSWLVEYWRDNENNISEIYICTDDGSDIKIWSSYGNDIFEGGEFESIQPEECYENMFFKGF